jgi:hypothetical protein
VRPLDDEEVDGVAEVVLVRSHDRRLRIDLQLVGQAFLTGQTRGVTRARWCETETAALYA